MHDRSARPFSSAREQAGARIDGSEPAAAGQLTNRYCSRPALQGRGMGERERVLPRDRAASIRHESNERNARSFVSVPAIPH